MMPTCTLYIVSCGNAQLHDPNIAREGVDMFFDVKKMFEIEGGTRFGELRVETEWKMFIYSDEFLSKSLIKILPFYLSANFDILVLYKLQQDTQGIYLCPRIFRGQIPLDNKALVPVRYDGYTHTRILDGFLMGRAAPK